MTYPIDVAKYVCDRSSELEGTWDQKLERIREEVKDKFELLLGHKDGDALRKFISKWKQRNEGLLGDLKGKADELMEKTERLSSQVESKKKYEVKDGKYYVPTKHGTFVFECAEADRIFFDYSEKGGDMTQDQVIEKYRLKPEAWNAIKSAFRLYKTSHVLSPHTLETASDEELEIVIGEKVGNHIDRFKQKFVQTHERDMAALYKKALKFYANAEYRMKTLDRAIKNWKPNAVELKDLPELPYNGILHVVLSDLHIGKIGTSLVLERLNVAKRKIIAAPETDVHLKFPGDLAEAFIAMHPNQIEKGTEQQYGYGYDLACNVADIIEQFIIELMAAGKRVHFFGISGNHDRSAENQKGDPEFSMGLFVYKLVQKGLRNTDAVIEIARGVVSCMEYENSKFVMQHGILRQSPEKFVLPYVDGKKYVIAIAGHDHTLKTNEGAGFLDVRVPAVAGRGKYDTDMNLRSEPGMAFIRENPYGSVDLEIVRFPRDPKPAVIDMTGYCANRTNSYPKLSEEFAKILDSENR